MVVGSDRDSARPPVGGKRCPAVGPGVPGTVGDIHGQSQRACLRDAASHHVNTTPNTVPACAGHPLQRGTPAAVPVGLPEERLHALDARSGIDRSKRDGDPLADGAHVDRGRAQRQPPDRLRSRASPKPTQSRPTPVPRLGRLENDQHMVQTVRAQESKDDRVGSSHNPAYRGDADVHSVAQSSDGPGVGRFETRLADLSRATCTSSGAPSVTKATIATPISDSRFDGADRRLEPPTPLPHRDRPRPGSSRYPTHRRAREQ